MSACGEARSGRAAVGDRVCARFTVKAVKAETIDRIERGGGIVRPKTGVVQADCKRASGRREPIHFARARRGS